MDQATECLPPRHPHKKLLIGEKTIAIDDELVTLISCLIPHGFSTYYSCQCDPKYGNKVTIGFQTVNDAVKFLDWTKSVNKGKCTQIISSKSHTTLGKGWFYSLILSEKNNSRYGDYTIKGIVAFPREDLDDVVKCCAKSINLEAIKSCFVIKDEE